MTIDQALHIAVQHHQAGRLADAEKIYRRILAQQPRHAEALRLFGTLAGQAGKFDAAVELLRRSIALKPDSPGAYSALGNSLQALARSEEAIAAYRQAILLKPDFADAHYNLAIAFQSARKTDEAIACYREAVAINPDYAEAHTNLAVLLQARNDFEQSILSLRQAIRLRPDLAEAHNNLGVALKSTGRLQEAVAAHRMAVLIKPDLAEAHNNLGLALKAVGQLDEAITAYREAARIRPEIAEIHSNLGNALRGVGQLEEAIIACQRAIELRPNLAEAYCNLGIAFKEMGQLDETIAAYRKALRLKPDYTEVHANLLFAMQYHPAIDEPTRLAESVHWNRLHAEPLRPFIRPHANDRDPGRSLRIGYVSPDLHNHPVSRFVLPLLAAHDHDKFDIFAYAHVPVPDNVTAKLKACCDTWRSTIGLSDTRVAEMIREDRVDILIDLAGHTADNHLLAFARKPAPVQVTWLGYPGTTGLATMDYRFTDALADPPGKTDQFCTEHLIRLPRTAWCYQPPDDSPPVSELPAIANGCVTFGSFNNFAKVNEPLLKLWAKILRATPGSKLLLKAKPLRCESVQNRVRQLMADAGVDPDRLELVRWVALSDHLAQYGKVDIALDTYPYHGTTTTCESLWMGVPVVTLAGESHVSRVGVSLLTSVGLSQVVAETPEQYVQIAADLAADLPRLAGVRRALRAQMQASSLMNGPRFARDIEAAYRQMWNKRCEKSI